MSTVSFGDGGIWINGQKVPTAGPGKTMTFKNGAWVETPQVKQMSTTTINGKTTTRIEYADGTFKVEETTADSTISSFSGTGNQVINFGGSSSFGGDFTESCKTHNSKVEGDVTKTGKVYTENFIGTNKDDGIIFHGSFTGTNNGDGCLFHGSFTGTNNGDGCTFKGSFTGTDNGEGSRN